MSFSKPEYIPRLSSKVLYAAAIAPSKSNFISARKTA